MKLSCIVLCLVLAIACIYVDETEAQPWRWGRRWGGWRRPWGGWGGGWGGPWGGPWGGFGGGWPGGWFRRPFFRRSSEELPTFDCKFDVSTKLLRCDGLNKTVECDALSVLDKTGTHPFTQFRISAMPIGGLKTKVEEMKYSLYPEKIDKSDWLDTNVEDVESKKSFTFSLYQLPHYTDSGLRVVSPICWRKLFDLFSEPDVEFHTISILKGDGKMEDVKVMGDILIKQ